MDKEAYFITAQSSVESRLDTALALHWRAFVVVFVFARLRSAAMAHLLTIKSALYFKLA